MFKLDAIIDDKHVADVIRFLDRKASEMSLRPIDNAIVKKGKVLAASDANSPTELVITQMQKALGTKRQFNSDDIRQALKACNRPHDTSNVSYLAKILISKKYATRKARGHYEFASTHTTKHKAR